MAPSQGLNPMAFLKGTLRELGVPRLEPHEKDWLLARWQPDFTEIDCRVAADMLRVARAR
jgi:hypothetical protein